MPLTDQLCTECGSRWAKYEPGICEACYRRRRRGAEFRRGICAHCGIEFVSKLKFSEKSGRRGIYCSRACKTAARVADGRQAEAAARHRYKRLYGLTLEQVAEMRGGTCAICGSQGTEGRWGNLHIDHDHDTGRVRGALCHSCNVGLGYFKHDPALLEAAGHYLIDVTP